MDLYSTSYKKQICDKKTHKWKDTDYIFNEVIVLAETLEDAKEKSRMLILQEYMNDVNLRGYITEETHLVDGVFFFHGGYNEGRVLNFCKMK